MNYTSFIMIATSSRWMDGNAPPQMQRKEKTRSAKTVLGCTSDVLTAKEISNWRMMVTKDREASRVETSN